jgi:hypothetical protein
MRMTFLRKALLIWMVAWLPFAGAMAAVMPISQSPAQTAVAAKPVMVLEIASQTESASEEFSLPCHGKASGEKSSLGQTCNHCVLCHLAGALALGSMPVMPQVAPTHIFDASPLLPHPSFVPDLPNPPPRASLA